MPPTTYVPLRILTYSPKKGDIRAFLDGIPVANNGRQSGECSYNLIYRTIHGGCGERCELVARGSFRSYSGACYASLKATILPLTCSVLTTFQFAFSSLHY
ncbi:unnamed protein product [Angiostrongylus costaricensis]|uniref:CUB domain-containing protein n=1 Tax=Angiostrongylus costaricensis TaxID=334426 RepID=A0A0R3PEK9_ANGCS|nr:unnamed protein product [Angiostrongylus costaricensis]